MATVNKTYTINATHEVFGRLASRVALLLRGKNNTKFQHNVLSGNVVIIKNITGIKFSGKKYEQKTYHHHTGYLGHVRQDKLRHLFETSPEKVFTKAVYNMLPTNKLRNEWMKNLKFEK